MAASWRRTRCWACAPDIRTALPGFYLGGASTGAGPLGTGLAGLAAATAVIADTPPEGLARWLP